MVLFALFVCCRCIIAAYLHICVASAGIDNQNIHTGIIWKTYKRSCKFRFFFSFENWCGVYCEYVDWMLYARIRLLYMHVELQIVIIIATCFFPFIFILYFAFSLSFTQCNVHCNIRHVQMTRSAFSLKHIDWLPFFWQYICQFRKPSIISILTITRKSNKHLTYFWIVQLIHFFRCFLFFLCLIAFCF